MTKEQIKSALDKKKKEDMEECVDLATEDILDREHEGNECRERVERLSEEIRALNEYLEKLTPDNCDTLKMPLND